jgi:preprotein translocase subunit SecD
VKKGRLLTSVVLTCLVCFGVLGAAVAANWGPVLGLDLAGGLSVVFEPVNNQQVSAGTLQTAANIMEQRALGDGLSSPIINVQGNTIQVQLPGVTDRAKALADVGNTAQLFFRPVLCEAPEYTPPAAVKGKPAPPTKYIPQSTTFTCPVANQITSAGYDASTESVDPPAAGAWASLSQYQSSTADQDSLDNGKYPVLLDGSLTGYGPRLLLGPALANGTIVKTAAAQLSSTNQWLVNVTLTGPGTTVFDSIATKLYHNLLANDIGGIVQSAPVLLANNYDTGVSINGGGTTGFTQDQANQLAGILQYGTLPVPFQILDQSFVSATLGHSSLTAGLTAGLLGLLLVMLYMVFYYRALGIVVILGLVTTGSLIYGLIAILGHTENLTLDLSGVTGLVVSVGITVDSYVVYFERLKDEIRSGRSVRASVDRGFKRAFRTVVAADAVSFLGAACLWLLSIGEVKGFAYWLGISTLIDVATAYFFTRPAVILLGRNRFVTDAKYIGIARGLAAAPEGTA